MFGRISTPPFRRKTGSSEVGRSLDRCQGEVLDRYALARALAGMSHDEHVGSFDQRNLHGRCLTPHARGERQGDVDRLGSAVRRDLQVLLMAGRDDAGSQRVDASRRRVDGVLKGFGLSVAAVVHHKTIWSDGATQISVIKVDPQAPAFGNLEAGDVILGAAGGRPPAPFVKNARTEVAQAITDAEKDGNKGALNLLVWRKGKTSTITRSSWA